MFLVFRLFKLCLSIDFQPLTSACADKRNNWFVMRSNVMKLLIFPPRQVLFIDNWAFENFVCILNSIFLHSQDTKSHSVSQPVNQSVSQSVSWPVSHSVYQSVSASSGQGSKSRVQFWARRALTTLLTLTSQPGESVTNGHRAYLFPPRHRCTYGFERPPHTRPSPQTHVIPSSPPSIHM